MIALFSFLHNDRHSIPNSVHNRIIIPFCPPCHRIPPRIHYTTSHNLNGVIFLLSRYTTSYTLIRTPLPPPEPRCGQPHYHIFRSRGAVVLCLFLSLHDHTCRSPQAPAARLQELTAFLSENSILLKHIYCCSLHSSLSP